MPERKKRQPDDESRAAEAEALQQREAFGAALRDVTRFARMLAILSEPVPQDRLLDQALGTLSEFFSADIVVLVDPVGTGTCAPLASIGVPEDVVQRPLSDAEGGYVSRVIRGQAPLVTDNAGTDPRVDPRLRSLGAETMAWLPVTGSLSARGVLILARCRLEPFSRADVDLLSTLTHRLGMALEAVQRSAQLACIERYGRDVGRLLDEAAVAREAVHAFPAALGAAGSALVVADPRSGYRCAARAGVDPAWDEAWCRLSGALARRSLPARGQPFSAEDAGAVLAGFAIEQPPDFPVRALCAAPLLRGGGAQGFLIAARFIPALFPPDSLQAAMLFAGQTAAALENARLYTAARRDLTDRIRMEEERMRLESQLRQAQRLDAIGTFAGGIAHDYSNLLLSVSGNLELAREEMREGTEAHRAVESALQAAFQASELTRRFIMFTDSGVPVTEAASLKDLIMEAVSHALEGSPVNAEFRFPADLWEVPLDTIQVRQALDAIAVNAREAMPDGGTIIVAAENSTARRDAAATDAEPDRFVMVAITDHGQGIPRENLPRIFDPYFSTKQRGETRGIGLGLAVAHAIIARHGGRIEVESERGSGSTFRVYLPVGAARGAAPEDVAPPRPSGALRILLLEDEPQVADAVIRMLRRMGYHDVEYAREGADALARFVRARDAGAPFRLALIDITIHGGTGGRETAQRLLEIDPGLPTIVSSGYSNDLFILRYRDYGFRGVLQKPFRMKDLEKAIHDALGE